MKALIVALVLTILNTTAYAKQKKENFYDELNPRRPDIKKVMEELEEDYRAKTGKTGILEVDPLEEFLPSCYRNSCIVWADVDKSAQRVYLYINGSLSYTWKTSTGKPGYTTPDMDRHPSGPVYDRYTSSKYPDAIHGTTRGNFSKLGTPASHGCIRLLPDNGYIFNRLVRKYGLSKVWVTVN
jgi:lipoprotein-anchoring transpeptidase ErfK/SrfK